MSIAVLQAAQCHTISVDGAMQRRAHLVWNRTRVYAIRKRRKDAPRVAQGWLPWTPGMVNLALADRPSAASNCKGLVI